MTSWTKLTAIVSVLVGLATLFLQREALLAQLPQAAEPYVPAVLLGAITFAAAWLCGRVLRRARAALQLYAISRRRAEVRRNRNIVADLRTLRAAHMVQSAGLPNEQHEGFRAVVIDGELSRMGLIPASIRAQGGEAMAQHLSWLIAAVEERGVDHAMSFLWPPEVQPRSWRRRTRRFGRRSLWHRVLDRLADETEEARDPAAER